VVTKAGLTVYIVKYSPPLIRTLSLQWQDGLIRGVAFLEGNNLVVFYFLSAPAICPDKHGALSGGEKFSSILLSVCIWHLVWYEGWLSLRGGRVYCHCILLFHCIRNLAW